MNNTTNTIRELCLDECRCVSGGYISSSNLSGWLRGSYTTTPLMGKTGAKLAVEETPQYGGVWPDCDGRNC